MTTSTLYDAIHGDRKALARCISMIEHQSAGFENMLQSLPPSTTPITGITGPPGAGKSTITDQLIARFIADEKTVAVLCIDPSSPFHNGALLGDRVRMNRWHDQPKVFIRSLAGKNSLGGLSPMVIEITDLLRSAGFDHVLIETIGVGQNEVEIARLADTTVVVLVPEAGDEIQTMKAGLMEVADVFVVNKSDRAGADTFIKHLKGMLAPAFAAKKEEVPVLKTTATKDEGIEALYDFIRGRKHQNTQRLQLLAERAYRLLIKKRLADVTPDALMSQLAEASSAENFNLYRWIEKFQ